MTQGTGKRLTPDQVQEIRRLYEQGMSGGALAKMFGKSDVAMRQAVIRAGGTLRDASASHRPYTLNERAFSVLDPDTCYWIGLMLTNGYILDGGATPRQGIMLQTRDENILHDLSRYLGGPKVNYKTNKEGRRYAYLNCRSHLLADRLAAYGVVPRKSHKVGVPESLSSSPPFWRGMIDGDGQITKAPKISITGTESTCLAFRAFCNALFPSYVAFVFPTGRKRRSHSCAVHGEVAKTVIKTLYDMQGPAIPRKKEIALWVMERFNDRTFRVFSQGSILPITGNEPLPIPVITEADAKAAFVRLQGITTARIKEDEESSHHIRHLSVPLKIDMQVKGVPKINGCSAYFHDKERWTCAHHGWRSPAELWSDYGSRHRFLLEGMQREGVVRRILLKHAYIASQMNPSIPKALFSFLGSRRILDPCAGWGDRLAAACAHQDTQAYLGFDVNEKLFRGYSEQIKLFGPGKDIQVKNQPFEEASIPEESFDTVFTSPPYFKAELYAGDRQSHVLYPTWNLWKKGFLYPMLEKAKRCLVKGGYLALCVANVEIDKEVIPLIETCSEWMNMNMTRHTVWSMKLRTKRGADKGHFVGEPILIYKKP